MNDLNVSERLKTFIERKALTYSQFADMCGIPRPSLSQFLSGRNKKISDVMVGQMHNMFPELSIVWLLFGEGPMENKKSDFNGQGIADTHTEFDQGLFSLDVDAKNNGEKIIFAAPNERKNENQKETGLKTASIDLQNAEIKIEKLQNKIKELQGQIENMKKNPRKAVQITVYYDDSTFETFFPR